MNHRVTGWRGGWKSAWYPLLGAALRRAERDGLLDIEAAAPVRYDGLTLVIAATPRRSPSRDEEVPMSEVLYTYEQVARRGEALFEERIRPELDEQEGGKFLVVDIESGDYELDADELQALKRAKAKKPEAVLYMLRLGDPTAYRLGRGQPAS